MESCKPIITTGFLPVVPPDDFGKPSEMRWLEISVLRVDKRYQRNISKGSKGNVRQIAAAFSWKKFKPVIVCLIEDGLYAIIDGQHRTTAAALIGITSVPCLIVEPLTLAEQAKAYKAINANITRVTSQDLYFADLAAGDPLSIQVDTVCKKVGIKIIKGTVTRDVKPNECQAVASLKALLRDYDEYIVLQSLVCLMRRSTEKVPLLRPQLIKAMVIVFHENRNWVGNKNIFNAVDRINFSRLLIESTTLFMQTHKAKDKCLTTLLEKQFALYLN